MLAPVSCNGLDRFGAQSSAHELLTIAWTVPLGAYQMPVFWPYSVLPPGLLEPLPQFSKTFLATGEVVGL